MTKQEIIAKYNEAFKDFPIMLLNHKDEEHISSGHLYLTRIKGIDEKTRNEIIIKMAEEGIACNVHYKPLPMLTAYKNLGFDITLERSCSQPISLVTLHLPFPVINNFFPSFSFFSYSVTVFPFLAAVIAAIMPAAPPPTTMILPID